MKFVLGMVKNIAGIGENTSSTFLTMSSRLLKVVVVSEGFIHSGYLTKTNFQGVCDILLNTMFVEKDP